MTPVIDSDLIAALPAAEPRVVSAERANSKPEGSRIVANSDTLIKGSAAAGGLSVFSALGDSFDVSGWLDKVEGLRGTATRIRDFAAPLMPYVTVRTVVLVGAVVVAIVAWRIRAARIEDHRTGATP